MGLRTGGLCPILYTQQWHNNISNSFKTSKLTNCNEHQSTLISDDQYGCSKRWLTVFTVLSGCTPDLAIQVISALESADLVFASWSSATDLQFHCTSWSSQEATYLAFLHRRGHWAYSYTIIYIHKIHSYIHSLHYTVLPDNYIKWRYITLHDVTWHDIAVHAWPDITLHCITLHNIHMYWIPSYYIAVHALHLIA